MAGKSKSKQEEFFDVNTDQDFVKRVMEEIAGDIPEYEVPEPEKNQRKIPDKKVNEILGVVYFALAIFLLYSLINWKIQEVPHLEGKIVGVKEKIVAIKLNEGQEISKLKTGYYLNVYQEFYQFDLDEKPKSSTWEKVGLLKVTDITEDGALAHLEKIDDGIELGKGNQIKTRQRSIFSWSPFSFRIDFLIARLFHALIGITSFMAPILLGTYAVLRFSNKPVGEAVQKILLGFCIFFFLMVIIGTIYQPGMMLGGYLGKFLTLFLNNFISKLGTIIFSVTVMIIAALLTSEFNFKKLLFWQRDETDDVEPPHGLIRPSLPFLKRIHAEKEETEEKDDEEVSEEEKGHRERDFDIEFTDQELSNEQPDEITPDTETHTIKSKKNNSKKEGKKQTRKTTGKKKKPKKKVDSNGEEEYYFPSFTLLEKPPVYDLDKRKAGLEKKATQLEMHLAEFGVEGIVTGVNPGPVITQYEFRPNPGIKISKIAALSDDLSMRMKAHPVRIIAPIPGKDAVGIEIPNPDPQIVYLRDVLDSREFTTIESNITIALGKDISGYPYCSDLADMPHLLIAGATGSGKSVGLNSIICSILFRANPNDVKFLMVDPKRLELNIYEGIPHLLAPPIVQANEAINALSWTVGEMERRYKLLASTGVRHIDSFNEDVDAKKIEAQKAGNKKLPKRLPYIIVIVDELADLMLTSAKEIETYLTRLAQMARAVGIHLVLATQRPSVDVITGIIKANFPSRISFQVASKVDSRTILDRNGAEQLLGHGDMLFLPAWSGKPIRVHGTYVSTTEVKKIVKFIIDKNPGWEPDELLSFKDFMDDESFTAEEYHSKDGLYQKAVDIISKSSMASTSMLQRKLRIGYPRAARLMDMMEEAGIVGPNQGGKAREVLANKEDPEESFWSLQEEKDMERIFKKKGATPEEVSDEEEDAEDEETKE